MGVDDLSGGWALFSTVVFQRVEPSLPWLSKRKVRTAMSPVSWTWGSIIS